MGADPARILAFKQTGGAASFLIIEKRKAIHQPLEGQLWVRASDGMPLRIVLVSQHEERGAAIRDESRVDYTMTPRGYLAPASVVHRQTSGGQLVVEDVYEYSDFRMFQSDTDIKFIEESLRKASELSPRFRRQESGSSAPNPYDRRRGPAERRCAFPFPP